MRQDNLRLARSGMWREREAAELQREHYLRSSLIPSFVTTPRQKGRGRTLSGGAPPVALAPILARPRCASSSQQLHGFPGHERKPQDGGTGCPHLRPSVASAERAAEEAESQIGAADRDRGDKAGHQDERRAIQPIFACRFQAIAKLHGQPSYSSRSLGPSAHRAPLGGGDAVALRGSSEWRCSPPSNSPPSPQSAFTPGNASRLLIGIRVIDPTLIVLKGALPESACRASIGPSRSGGTQSRHPGRRRVRQYRLVESGSALSLERPTASAAGPARGKALRASRSSRRQEPPIVPLAAGAAATSMRRGAPRRASCP